MNIIVFGPPGAGKGTQAENISKSFNLNKISTGDLLRNEIYQKTSLGIKIKSIVDNQLRNDLVGEDPTFVERLWEKMYSGSRSQMALRTGISTPILGRRGETICAISGVDIALWDILGKSMDQPIYKILGASRDNIRSYINCGYGSPREINCFIQIEYK